MGNGRGYTFVNVKRLGKLFVAGVLDVLAEEKTALRLGGGDRIMTPMTRS